MSAFNKFNDYVNALADGKHDLATDQLMVALTNVAPVAPNAVLADLTEISYLYLSARLLTTSSSGQTGGTYKVVVQPLTISASGGNASPFRYVVVYNNTAAGKNLIGWYDYGSSLTLNNGESFLVNFDTSNGLLQVA